MSATTAVTERNRRAERTAPDEGRELAEALVRLAHALQHVFAEVSRQHNLTAQQTQLLCRLTDGPFGMTELSRLLHLEKSSLTGLVDRVERRGLVDRRPDPHDRRAFQIALTGEGGRLATKAHEEVLARFEVLTGDLRPAQKERMNTAIEQVLQRAVGRAVEPRSGPVP